MIATQTVGPMLNNVNAVVAIIDFIVSSNSGGAGGGTSSTRMAEKTGIS